MHTLREVVLFVNKTLISHGFEGAELKREIARVAKRKVVSDMATSAFDKEIPIDQGPVWFGDEAWKTDFWRRQWQHRKAYVEGETHRTAFGDRDNNPYRQSGIPMVTAQIDFELAWSRGFDGEEF
jgi:hypothetical protein